MVSCHNCYFLVYLDDDFQDMECVHGNAVPENGAPLEINGSDEHECPFWESDA